MQNLIEVFSEFKESAEIKREDLLYILEKVFINTLKKKYNDADNFDVIVNVDKGDLEIMRHKEIVDDDDFIDDETQMKLSDALKIEPDFEVGEEVSEEVKLTDFTRREIQSMRQHLITKIIEHKGNSAYKKYINLINEIFIGDIRQKSAKEFIVVDDTGNELILPRAECIPGDEKKYKKGEYIKAIILNVETINNRVVISLSRTSPKFLEGLLEFEVPEIYDGLITVKKVVRLPGKKAKILVETYDDRIDPVGSVVGMSGSRIRGVVEELNGENIDVINYTNNTELLVKRLLNPAKIEEVTIDDVNKKIIAVIKKDQIPLAIGKGGVNIKLANMLVDYELEIYREAGDEEEDVELSEFHDEIEPWIIETFYKTGFDTAKSIINSDIETLVSLTKLEENTIKEIIRILKLEFE